MAIYLLASSYLPPHSLVASEATRVAGRAASLEMKAKKESVSQKATVQVTGREIRALFQTFRTVREALKSASWITGERLE